MKCCVVNAELPLASRYHVVEEFNRGVYDVVVGTDEGAGPGDGEPEPDSGAEVEKEDEEIVDKVENGDTEDQAGEEEPSRPQSGPSKRKPLPPQPQSQSRKRRRADPSSTLARGIDFTSASSVINFDLPPTSTSYMHRIGRTARAGHSGLALSFIVPQSQWGKDRAVSLKSARDDEVVWARIVARVKKEDGGEVREWDWGGKRGEVEGFRYRMEDALRSVTGKRVAEARREEVRRELLNSEKLKVGPLLHPPRTSDTTLETF